MLQTNNDAGLYGFRFYIRGKPWDVVVDDQLFLTSGGDFIFSKANSANLAMWGPVLEKAWAKALGSYAAYTG